MITLTAKITLADGTEIEVGNRKDKTENAQKIYVPVLSIDCSTITRNNIAMPSWGIISNNGSIKFVDYDDTIKSLIQQNKLSQNAYAVITLENTLAKSNMSVSCFLTKKWNYDNNDKTVTVSLGDDLEEWQDIQARELNLSQSLNTGLDVYVFLKNITPTKWEFKELDEITTEVLSNYQIRHAYLEATNLWQQWNKLCVACGLHIFKNIQDKVVVSYDFRS
jgi:hypothetical protein